ncbi:MAG TPA: Fic family protein [Candidatus Babeliales bacterium]|nr:Fic family protein [Candidatus Babeliales bacterium]
MLKASEMFCRFGCYFCAFFLVPQDALLLNDEIAENSGNISGCRDIKLLESAMANPLHSTCYGEDYNILSLAAEYYWSISENQPFNDCNKRTGLLAALKFLGLNGIIIKELHIPQSFFEKLRTRKDVELFFKSCCNI